MKVLSLITARGGSKGIPGKNIIDFAGKPLIAWSIEASLKSLVVDRTVVSTDDKEIAGISREYGADIPFMRPGEHSRDNSPHIPVVRHAVKWLEDNENDSYDYIVLLQPTSPFRVAFDIDSAVNVAVNRNACAVMSVCEVDEHPYFVRKINSKGLLELFIGRGRDIYYRRQELPEAYIENGAVYVVQRDILMNDNQLYPDGQTSAYVMPRERSLDIDTPWDLRIGRMIMKEFLKDGKFK